ncbi:MAG: TetR/AcrR family transcriptional regulator [Bdellovibrionales bacterium]
MNPLSNSETTSASRIVKDHIRYLLFSEIYFKLSEPKSRRRALHILEAAIKCFSRRGMTGVTVEMIAREAGVARSLINHYFEGPEDVQMCAIKYIRLIFQKFCLDALSREPDPALMLERYIRCCFEWLQKSKTHALVWCAFLERCARLTNLRRLNTEAVRVGTERIETLLQSGVATGHFSCHPTRVAKPLQIFITGAMVSFMSEAQENREEFIDMVVGRCLEMARAQ